MVAAQFRTKFQSIIDRIQRDYKFDWIDLREMDITDNDLLILQDELRNSTSTANAFICSNNNQITIEGYRTIYSIITTSNISLQSLLIYSNNITYEIVQYLASTVLVQQSHPNLSKLKVFDLSDNESIGIEGFLTIVQAFESNTVIESLDLSYTLPNAGISTIDQKRLAQSLQPILVQNNTLKSLVISNDGLGDEFMIEFVPGLRYNQKIRDLFIGRGFSTIGITPFAKILKENKTLESIHFDDLTEECCIVLFQALEYNTTLRLLNVCHDELHYTEPTIKAILESLQYNDTLRSFYSTQPNFRPIQTILQNNRTGRRTAPKKGSRQRYDVFRLLRETWLYREQEIN